METLAEAFKELKNAVGGRLHSWVMWICAALAMICVVAGRIETVHMTEGEAFIYGWKYWVATIAFVFVAALLSKRTT